MSYESLMARIDSKPPLNGHQSRPRFELSVGQPFWNVADSEYVRDPWLMKGLLRRREVMNLVADSKAYKTFTVLCMAVCQAFELKFMGQFKGSGGRVLVIDNELKPNSYRSRGKLIADHYGIDPKDFEDRIHVHCCRDTQYGIPNIYELEQAFETVKKSQYELVIIDSLYRSWPKGMSENDNNAITDIYNKLNQYCRMLDASIVCTVHTSSGNQAGKKNTDIGVGGKAMSRAADVHSTILQHEKEGYAVFQANVRDDVSIQPQSIFMKFPVWQTSEISPAVKQPKTKHEQRTAEQDKGVLSQLADVFKQPFTANDFRKEFGFGTDKTNRLICLAVNEKRITKCGKSARKSQLYKVVSVD